MTEASKLKKDDAVTSIHSFATALTVAALATNQSWPTLRIPYLESYGDRYLDLIKGDHAALAVLVKGEDRARYEQHMVQEHTAMMQEAHMLHYGNLDMFDPAQFTPFIAKATSEGTLVPDDEGKDMYVPVHFNSPPTYESVNWNIATSPLYGNVVNLARTFPHEIYTTAIRNATHVHNDPRPFSDTAEPHIRYFHAVTDQISMEADDNNNDNAATANVVGILTVTANLETFTTGFLPDDVQGIMVVFRNTCHQNFTYVVNGKESTYVGPGDLHQAEFETFEVKVNLTDHSTAGVGECLFTQVIVVKTQKCFVGEWFQCLTPKFSVLHSFRAFTLQKNTAKGSKPRGHPRFLPSRSPSRLSSLRLSLPSMIISSTNETKRWWKMPLGPTLS